VVEHGCGGEGLEFCLVLGLDLGDLVLELLDPAGEGGEFLVDEFLDVLGVAFDPDHDIPAPLFDFIYIEDPVVVHEVFLFDIERLKEHIGLILDFVVDQKLFELSTHMGVQQVPTLDSNSVRLPQELRVLQEQEELDRYVNRVFRFEFTHYSNIEIISSEIKSLPL
jgi:hypothetical protein